MAGEKTVWLVGMMGAGKSSVGPVLARCLGLPFVDTDAEIERRAAATVREIFASEGEAGFRARERGVIEDLCGRAAVVALGGGALSQPGVRQRVEGQGRVVYLRARPETLARRIGEAEERPLMSGLDARERLQRIRELLAQREQAYGSAAIVVDTDAAGVEEVVERVLESLVPG